MRFRWDNDKNESNFEKHGFVFEEAENIFDGPAVVFADTRADYGETRYRAFGQLEGVVVALIFTRPDEETCRCISLRRASAKERLDYENHLKNRLG